MPQVLTITAAMMEGLPGTPVSETTDASGYTSFAAMNVSPYFWQVRDSLGNFLAPVPPWSFVLGNVQVPTVTLTVVSHDTLPQVPVAGVTSSSYQLRLELSTVPVSPSVTTLAPAMAANSQVTATIPGTVGVQGVSGGTAVGVAIGETVNVALQSVSGNVPVTVQSGSITATIPGTVGVQGVSGGVAVGVTVGNTVNVSVQNATLNVAVVSASTTLNVSIQNSQISVVFPSAQEVNITETVTLPANVQNVSLTAIPLVAWTEQSFGISLAAGASTGLGVYPGSSYLSEYDGIYIRLNSSGQQVANLSFKIESTSVQEYGLISSTWALPVTWRESNAQIAFSNFIPLSPSAVFDDVNIVVTNNGTTTDTETLTIQVYARYAGATVTNPQTNPVQSQAASGSWDTANYTNGGTQNGPTETYSIAASSTLTQTYPAQTVGVIASGNYMSALYVGAIEGSLQASVTLTITCTNGLDLTITGGSLYLQLFNGSQLLAQNGTTTKNSTGATSFSFTTTLSLPSEFQFGRGVANNGINLVASPDSIEVNNANGQIADITMALSIAWNPMWTAQGSTNPPANVNVVS